MPRARHWFDTVIHNVLHKWKKHQQSTTDRSLQATSSGAELMWDHHAIQPQTHQTWLDRASATDSRPWMWQPPSDHHVRRSDIRCSTRPCIVHQFTLTPCSWTGLTNHYGPQLIQSIANYLTIISNTHWGSGFAVTKMYRWTHTSHAMLEKITTDQSCQGPKWLNSSPRHFCSTGTYLLLSICKWTDKGHNAPQTSEVHLQVISQQNTNIKNPI